MRRKAHRPRLGKGHSGMGKQLVPRPYELRMLWERRNASVAKAREQSTGAEKWDLPGGWQRHGEGSEVLISGGGKGSGGF